MKILKSLEDSGLLIKGVNETIKNEAKEQKGGFLRMLLGTLGASLLENLLTSKGKSRTGEGTNRAGILKYKIIMKMNLNLMVFNQETIYLK